MKKAVLILAMLALVFTGCEKENVEQQEAITADLQTRRGFPQSISLEDYFMLSLTSGISPRESDFVEFGSKNETEWFIEDRNNTIQYYELNEQTNMLHAINEFSGRVIDYENDTSRGRRICSYSLDNGCTIQVHEYQFFSTSTVNCSSGSHTEFFAGGLGTSLLLCAQAALIAAM